MSLRLARHMHALSLARETAAWGARAQTISRLTGLRVSALKALLGHESAPPRRGRLPVSADWYHWANSVHRMEASLVMSLHSQLRRSGFAPPDALVGAYRAYVDMYRTVRRVNFDRAFDLAGHLEGLWSTRTPSLTQIACAHCGGLILVAAGTTRAPSSQCPMCRLVSAYPLDARIRYSLRHITRADARKAALAVRFSGLAHADADSPATTGPSGPDDGEPPVDTRAPDAA